MAIDSPKAELIASSRHFGDEDEVRVRVVLDRALDPAVYRYFSSFGIHGANSRILIPPNEELHVRGRLCYPIRRNQTLLGFLWLIDNGRPPEEIDGIVDQFLPQIAESIVAQRADTARAERADQLLRRLLCGDPSVDPEEVYALTTLRRGQELRVAVQLDPTRPMPGLRGTLAIIDGRNVRAILCEPSAFAQPAGDAHPPDGVSGLGEANDLQRLAEEAYLAAVASMDFALTPPVRWDRLGGLALLVQHANDHPADAAVVRPVELLRGADQQALIETAETYLDLGCDRTAAAAELFVHRSTLYYRLAHVERLTGLDLSSGLDRLALHAAIKIDRLRGAGRLTFRHSEEFAPTSQ